MTGPKTWTILAAVAVMAMTMAAYVPAMGGGFVWDDDSYVTANAVLRAGDGLQRIWLDRTATPQYYPLVFSTFWAEYRLWELSPLGYHLVNAVLHGLGAVLLWLVLRRLSVPGAWAAAAIFALHPVQVESVAWITERKNVLSGVFYLGAGLAYLRFCGLGASPAGGLRDWRFYPPALLLFACALLSKSVTCSLPAAILLVVWWKRGSLGWRDVVPLVPMFVLGAALAANTVWMERHHVGAAGPEWALPFAHRWLIAGRAVWFYAAKLLWPAQLTFIYPRWEVDAGCWWQWGFPVSAGAVVAALWLARHRLGRGPLVAVLFFGGTLVPALGFIDIFPFRYSFVADHFQYLASAGLIALPVALAATVLGWAGRSSPAGVESGGAWSARKLVGVVLTGGAFGVLGVLTWNQGQAYRAPDALWRDTLAKNPSAWIAHAHLARSCEERGQVRQALDHYARAVALAPGSVEVRGGLGVLLLRLGRVAEAVEHLVEAKRLRPDLAAVRHNLAGARVRQGRVDEAMAELGEALRLEPSPDRHFLLGNLLSRQGRLEEAIAEYRAALRMAPNHGGAARGLTAATAKRAEAGGS